MKRRSSPKRTNLLNVAQSVILGNAVTTTLFNTNMYEFVTGRINGAYTPGSTGQGSQITLPELFGAGMGTTTSQMPGSYLGATTTSTSPVPSTNDCSSTTKSTDWSIVLFNFQFPAIIGLLNSVLRLI